MFELYRLQRKYEQLEEAAREKAIKLNSGQITQAEWNDFSVPTWRKIKIDGHPAASKPGQSGLEKI